MFWTSRLNSTLTGWPRGSRQRGRWGSIEGRFHSQHRWHKAGSCSLGWWQGVAPVQTPPWWGPRSHWNRWHGFYPSSMRLWIPAAKRLINVTFQLSFREGLRIAGVWLLEAVWRLGFCMLADTGQQDNVGAARNQCWDDAPRYQCWDDARAHNVSLLATRREEIWPQHSTTSPLQCTWMALPCKTWVHQCPSTGEIEWCRRLDCLNLILVRSSITQTNRWKQNVTKLLGSYSTVSMFVRNVPIQCLKCKDVPSWTSGFPTLSYSPQKCWHFYLRMPQ